jgi:prophage regulatory protein
MDKTDGTLADRTADKQSQRRRTLAEIVAEKERNTPPLPKGQRDHQWPSQRGPPIVIWRLPMVQAVTGMAKSALWKAISEGLFPKPIHIFSTGRAVGWVASEVIDHIEQRIKARDEQVPTMSETSGDRNEGQNDDQHRR